VISLSQIKEMLPIRYQRRVNGLNEWLSKFIPDHFYLSENTRFYLHSKSIFNTRKGYGVDITRQVNLPPGFYRIKVSKDYDLDICEMFHISENWNKPKFYKILELNEYNRDIMQLLGSVTEVLEPFSLTILFENKQKKTQ
jgi:cupin superfamily acireductone dioxygenase involved in methionine salvage